RGGAGPGTGRARSRGRRRAPGRSTTARPRTRTRGRRARRRPPAGPAPTRGSATRPTPGPSRGRGRPRAQLGSRRRRRPRTPGCAARRWRSTVVQEVFAVAALAVPLVEELRPGLAGGWGRGADRPLHLVNERLQLGAGVVHRLLGLLGGG